MPDDTILERAWFEIETISAGITMISEPWHAERVHSYLIEGERDVAILDTGMGVGDFASLVRETTDREPLVIQTHAHWDHIGASARFERVLIHPEEADDLISGATNEELRPWFTADQVKIDALPDAFDLERFSIPGAAPTGYLLDNQRIDLGGREIRIYHTPGHSPGSVSIYDPASGILFPADAVNYGPIFLLGGEADLVAYCLTLERLVELAADAKAIYPSHYDVPLKPTDVGDAREAYERVLKGELEPHRETGIDRYLVNRFVFLIDAGRLEE